jgi:2-haloacid dehalogenase
MASHGIRAIITDTGGTVFDWHSAVLEGFTTVGAARGLTADWPALVKTWRRLSTVWVDKGLPFVNGRVEMDMDDVLRETLTQTLQQHSVTGFTESDRHALVHSWRNMPPWEDIPKGVARLRKGLIVCPFTILKTALIIHASRGKVDWDTVISCEMIGVYKTDPRTYAAAVRWLDVKTEEVLLVTAHTNDLMAGHKFGMKTAFIRREKEWGEIPNYDLEPAKEADFVADTFEELATQLGL